MPDKLNGFQLQVEFFPADATTRREPDPMASFPLVNVDWEPALACAKWERVLRDPRPPIVLDLADGKLEPSWDHLMGRPYIKGIEVTFGDERSPADNVLLPLTYFRDAATDAASQLVAAGQLVAGATFRLRISACFTEPVIQANNNAAPTLQVYPIAEPLELQEGCVSSLLCRASLAEDQPENGMPVFVPRTVLQETHCLTRNAGGVETGGVLIGHLGIDRTIPEIFAHVTAQIPAVHARQELTSLTWTPETWTAVDAAVRLRGRGERYLGWWHSHPDFCASCPEEKRRLCQLQCDFFSAQDKSLHRCCFTSGFQIALVVSDNGAADLSTAMYGWRAGTIQRRGFHVL